MSDRPSAGDAYASKNYKNVVKIATLNCAGLAAHYVDIEKDEHLMKADVIHLIET